ncbi:MAG TPA: CopG family antitoxin [Rhodospirillales bacterium]|nr:CopG family antitoxin [Rhodospirillales bacterium]
MSSDEAAERFVSEADLGDYDLSTFMPVRFEFDPGPGAVSVPLPASLLDAVMRQAKASGMPYQRFIREAIERALKDAPVG